MSDFNAPRLFTTSPLEPSIAIGLDPAQRNYLLNVLRLKAGDFVLVFNGRDGEWRAVLDGERKNSILRAEEQTRPQPPSTDFYYLFAPLKHARLDYMVQKAVEMGAGRLQPILTRRTQSTRINLERMQANAVEAAEQCGILNVPQITAPQKLPEALAALSPERWLVFCDEDAPRSDPFESLAPLRSPDVGVAVMVGPEGGFATEERLMVQAHSRVIRLSLGPRILRADTAAVAALALVQAVLGR